MANIAIKENMEWPPINPLRWKVMEHSAWYSGDPNILANYYEQVAANNVFGLPFVVDKDLFWGRQLKNDIETAVHVPIAGDIASTSADLLFSEHPQIKVVEAHQENAPESAKVTQENLELMLNKSGFFRRIIETAETVAAVGGGFIKIAWDRELSEYPIPVVEQIDDALPHFKFGILTSVTFWKDIKVDDQNKKCYRLLETYNNDGSIIYQLFQGTMDRLGYEIDLNYLEETKGIQNITTNIKDILAVYIPNILPNRYFRGSFLGRSDYAGIEGMMASLDEVFSSWIKDIILAQAKVYIPESFLQKDERSGFKFNVDQLMYTQLDMDPTIEGDKITLQQFEIRAEQFEKTSLNLLDRIISSAGYSPQSFGLEIDGRAESGTALLVRERKSLSTKSKKESYWEPSLKKIIKLMLVVYKTLLKGKVDPNVEITTQFSDTITNDVSEISESLSKITQAVAASTETKVRILHPDWSEDEVQAEVSLILEENNMAPMEDPDKIGANFEFNEEEDSDDDEGQGEVDEGEE